MAKQTNPTGYHVIVEPRSLGDLGFVLTSDRLVEPDDERRIKQYHARCEEIVADIKRHVDNVAFAHVVAETEIVCEHCGAKWTEVGADYNGGCCPEDEAAHVAAGAPAD